MKKLITLLALMFCLNGKAQTYAAIPDSSFVHFLKTIASTAFKGDSLDTSNTLVTTTIHSMICSNKSIVDLTGITYFKSLRYLNCSNNSSGNFYISVLPDSVTYLDCSNNGLSNLSLPITLKHLNCSFCWALNLATLPDSLNYFNCTNACQIPPNFFPNSLDTIIATTSGWTTIPALPNSLVYLDLNTDNFYVLPPLPNTLKYLDVYDSFIACLPTLPSSLQYLDARMTQIKCFPNFPSGALILSDSAYTLCGPGNPQGCPDVISSISQIKAEDFNFKYYPNPTNNQFYIDANTTNNLIVDLYDVNGRHVFNKVVSDKSNIDVTTLNEGVYSMIIKTADHVINNKLLILR